MADYFRWDADAYDVSLIDYHQEKDMLPENRIPTRPGEVLLGEFLHPMELSQAAFAEHIGVSVQRVNEMGAFHVCLRHSAGK